MAFDAAARPLTTTLGTGSVRSGADVPLAMPALPAIPALPARPAAPLVPLQRDWLRTWAGRLDASLPPAPGPALVRAVLRAVPAQQRTARLLAAWPATPLAPSVTGLPNVGERATLGPRSMGRHLSDGGAPRRRTAELLAALSAGLDAAEDRPVGHAVRTAIIGVRIAESLERTEQIRAIVLYAGLLRDSGTTGRTAAVPGKPAHRGARPPAHLSHPDRAAAVIRSLSLPATVAAAVCAVDERWDGRGALHLKHDAIPLEARILAVASIAAQAVAAVLPGTDGAHADVVSAAVRGVENALRQLRGKELDPAIVDACLKLVPSSFWKRLVQVDPMDQLLEAEPAGDIRRSTPEHVDAVCATFADLVDTRTPMMGRHGVRVAELAEAVAGRLGFDPIESRELRRAGLLHDIGKLLVPIAYLEKAAELTPEERAVIQDHPHAGAQILRRSRVLAGLAPLVDGHHEALNGDGHFPDFQQQRMALAARILAVCDRYEAMTSERPYRPLLATAQVWWLLEDAATEPMARQAFLSLRSVVEAD